LQLISKKAILKNYSKMDNLFKKILNGKIVVIGIGNILRGDDGFGPELIKKIQGKVNAVCIDAGTTPESYAGKVIKAKPDTVLIIDVADICAVPGEFRILKKEEIYKSGFTTHDISPRMFIDYLAEQTKADIYMLAIQPERIGIGDDMSSIVLNTLKETESILKSTCPKE